MRFVRQFRHGPVLVAWIVGVATCGETSTEPEMTRAAFIEVVVALREAARDEPEDFEVRKAEIFEAAGVTDSLLFRYLRSLESPAALAEVMGEVNARMAEPVPGEDEGEDTIGGNSR